MKNQSLNRESRRKKTGHSNGDIGDDVQVVTVLSSSDESDEAAKESDTGGMANFDEETVAAETNGTDDSPVFHGFGDDFAENGDNSSKKNGVVIDMANEEDFDVKIVSASVVAKQVRVLYSDEAAQLRLKPVVALKRLKNDYSDRARKRLSCPMLDYRTECVMKNVLNGKQTIIRLGADVSAVVKPSGDTLVLPPEFNVAYDIRLRERLKWKDESTWVPKKTHEPGRKLQLGSWKLGRSLQKTRLHLERVDVQKETQNLKLMANLARQAEKDLLTLQRNALHVAPSPIYKSGKLIGYNYHKPQASEMGQTVSNLPTDNNFPYLEDISLLEPIVELRVADTVLRLNDATTPNVIKVQMSAASGPAGPNVIRMVNNGAASGIKTAMVGNRVIRLVPVPRPQGPAGQSILLPRPNLASLNPVDALTMAPDNVVAGMKYPNNPVVRPNHDSLIPCRHCKALIKPGLLMTHLQRAHPQMLMQTSQVAGKKVVVVRPNAPDKVIDAAGDDVVDDDVTIVDGPATNFMNVGKLPLPPDLELNPTLDVGPIAEEQDPLAI